MDQHRSTLLATLCLGALLAFAGEGFADSKSTTRGQCTNKNQVGDVQYDASSGGFWVCKASGWELIEFSRFVGPQGPAGVAGPVGPVGPKGPQGPVGDSVWTQPQSGVSSIMYTGEVVVSSVTAGEVNAGTIRISDSDAACDAAHAGLMRFRAETKKFEGCNGTAWVALAAPADDPSGGDGGLDGGGDGRDAK